MVPPSAAEDEPAMTVGGISLMEGKPLRDVSAETRWKLFQGFAIRDLVKLDGSLRASR
jgi:hypothetical protein